VVSGIYGLIIVALGAIELGMELSNLTANSENVWSALSTNQKLYYINNLQNLENER